MKINLLNLLLQLLLRWPNWASGLGAYHILGAYDRRQVSFLENSTGCSLV